MLKKYLNFRTSYTFTILVSMLLLGSAAKSFANCLPELSSLNIPKAFYICKKDQDCIIAGDACRSCQKGVAINRKYKEEFDRIDSTARLKANCVLSCEACSIDLKIVKCVKNSCLIK